MHFIFKILLTIENILKYGGVLVEDLIHIYILYVRSLLEYCSVVWHSTLTADMSHDIERVQKLCLKIILGQSYSGYDNATNTVMYKYVNDIHLYY